MPNEVEDNARGARNRVVGIDFDSDGNVIRTEWQCGCVIRTEGYNSLCCEHAHDEPNIPPNPGRGDSNRLGRTFSSGV